MQNQQFTEKLQAWLNTPEQERDYDEGNLLLLQLSNNKIRYNNFARNAKSKSQSIIYELRKYLNFRLQKLTHEQVEEMQKKVDAINEKMGLDKVSQSDSQATTSGKSKYEEFKAGKRADHDSLPEEIQALYIENLSILQRMRELHLKLRTLSIDDAPCPDSDRYPFLKELIALDKKMHDNWYQYDHWHAQSEEATSVLSDFIAESQTQKAETSEQPTVLSASVAESKKSKATKKTTRKKKKA